MQSPGPRPGWDPGLDSGGRGKHSANRCPQPAQASEAPGPWPWSCSARRPGAEGRMKSFQGTLCSSHEWEGWRRVTCLWASLHRAGPGRVTGPFPAPRQSWLPAPAGLGHGGASALGELLTPHPYRGEARLPPTVVCDLMQCGLARPRAKHGRPLVADALHGHHQNSSHRLLPWADGPGCPVWGPFSELLGGIGICPPPHDCRPRRSRTPGLSAWTSQRTPCSPGEGKKGVCPICPQPRGASLVTEQSALWGSLQGPRVVA